MSKSRKKPGCKPRHTPAEIAEAIRATNGLLTVAARKLGLRLETVCRYVSSTAECAKAAEEAIEGVKDLAEAKLYNAINESKSWAICFFLKCRAKDRGYIERELVDTETARMSDGELDERIRKVAGEAGFVRFAGRESAAVEGNGKGSQASGS